MTSGWLPVPRAPDLRSVSTRYRQSIPWCTDVESCLVKSLHEQCRGGVDLELGFLGPGITHNNVPNALKISSISIKNSQNVR